MVSPFVNAPARNGRVGRIYRKTSSAGSTPAEVNVSGGLNGLAPSASRSSSGTGVISGGESEIDNCSATIPMR